MPADEARRDYDIELFARLRWLHAQAPETNEPFAFMSPDAVESAGAAPASPAAAHAISQARVGVVVLAGGMATRFGGLPKAAVDLWPGVTLLDVKLSLAQAVARRFDATIPVVIVSSDATERTISDLLARRSFDALQISLLRQTLLPRMLAGGALARLADGQLDMCPPGHGEVVGLLARHGPEIAAGVEFWMVSNIDNVLASPDDNVLSSHLRSRAAATVEVVDGAASDTGGFLVRSGDRNRILEGFQVKDEDRPSGPFLFSTNSFVLGPEVLSNYAALPFHAVRKQNALGDEIIQFEQLLGDVGLLGTLNPVRVRRHGTASRFVALKTREAFDASKRSLRDQVEARLGALGADGPERR